MIVQGAFHGYFRSGARLNFREGYTSHTPQYSQIARMGTTDSPEVTATIMAGLSRLFERGDAESVIYRDPVEGPIVAAVDKEFAAGFAISRRTVEDDKYGKANQSAKWLGHATRMTYEYRFAQVLDDAFTGTTFKGIDGLSLINDSHTLINSSSTFSNNIGAVSFSLTGLTAMMDLAQQAKDQNGDPIVMNVDTLVIGNNAGDLNRALAIWHSSKEPFTAENQENVVRMRLNRSGAKREPIVSAYKTSRTSWFAFDSKLNDVHFLMRRKATFDDTFDFDTDVAKYKVSTRILIWFVDPIGWFGANPS